MKHSVTSKPIRSCITLLLLLLSVLMPASVQAVKPAPPVAPSGLTASAVSTSQINLRWVDNSANETGFRIQRAMSSAGPWSQIAMVGKDVVTYANTGLEDGVTYYYRVCAYNSRGSSAYSAVASASTLLQQQCVYSLSASGASFTSASANGSVYVTTSAGCTWTASSSAFWISITAGTSGNGSAWVSYLVTANTAPTPRTGYLTIAGKSYRVDQAAAPCNYSITPGSVNVGSAANSGTVSVSALGGCAWSATSSAAWITITAGASGNGNGSVSYYVAGNTATSPRTGYLTIAGKTFTVNQAAAAVTCTYSISPPSASFAATGGNGSISISANVSTCPWVASTTYGWITITSLGSGSGNGTVNYSVSANTSTSSRSGTISVVGQTFSVSQAGAAPDAYPTASLTAPTSGATLTGTATFSGNATDDVGVTKVEFWCDGTVLLGTDTTAPYSVSYNTAGLPNGTRTFTCKSFDTTGKSTTSAGVSATVNNSTVSTGTWAKRFGGAGSDYGQAVAVDASGNTFVAGYFESSVDFGGGLLISAGLRDAFLAKYSPSGTHMWSKRFGGIDYDEVKGVAVDAAGNVIITGSFRGAIDFGTGLLVSAGEDDIFAAKFNASGVCLWAKRFGAVGDPFYHTDRGYGVAVDALGNVLLTGYFGGVVSFGGNSLTNWSGVDMYVTKLTPDGAHIWSKNFPNSANDKGFSIVADRNGDVILTGCYLGQINYGGGAFTSAGSEDVFVLKVSGASGAHLWSKSFGANVDDEGLGLAVDSANNVIVTGFFNYTINAGGGSLTSAGGADIFVIKYSASGAHTWSKRFGSMTGEMGWGVAVDRQDNVILSGQFSSTVDFGGTPLSSAGQIDSYVAKYSALGNLVWAKRFGGTSNDAGLGVTVNGDNQVLLTGFFQGTVDFAGVSLSSPGPYNSDVFLLKLQP